MDYQKEYIKKNPGLHLEQSKMKALQILNFLDGLQVKSLLDVACGAGKITKILSKSLRSHFTVGLDVSGVMIENAKRNGKCKNIHWINKDVFKYYPKEKFDLVICIDVLEHIKNDRKFLRKVKTLGNQILLKIPMEDSFLDNHIIRTLKINDPWKESEIKYGHIHHYNENQLMQMFKEYGLKIIKDGYIPLPKRSLLFYEVLRILFLPLGFFSQKAMANFVGGFKIVLLSAI
jgi:trans-aconitate methyltransferase